MKLTDRLFIRAEEFSRILRDEGKSKAMRYYGELPPKYKAYILQTEKYAVQLKEARLQV